MLNKSSYGLIQGVFFLQLEHWFREPLNFAFFMYLNEQHYFYTDNTFPQQKEGKLCCINVTDTIYAAQNVSMFEMKSS